MSLLITNCKLVGIEGIKNILIEDGKMKDITAEAAEADKVVDAKENIVLPGVIDPHVHFRDPGLTHKEDFESGSIAAAAGGITTIIDMPNTKPPTFTLKDVEDKKKLAEKRLNPLTKISKSAIITI